MNQLLRNLFDRLLVLLGRAFASRVETYSLIEEIENKRLVEEHAQKLENAGYVEAAADLRRRSALISPDAPAGSASAAMLDLCTEPQQVAIEGPADTPRQAKRRRSKSASKEAAE